MSTLPDAAQRLTRNKGFISSRQQAQLGESCVAIAGVGGVGGRVATELVRLGVTRLRLADPDIFTTTNLNRQEGSYVSTLNQSKVEVIAALCRDINPEVDIKLYPHGVSEDNIEEFVAGASLLVEATDFMLPHLGVMLARKARSHSVPLIMGVEIGFGATLTWFDPHGSTYERYFGLKDDVALADLASEKVTVDFGRWLPHVPAYGDMEVLRSVSDGKADVPAIAPAVGICAALISTQAISLLGGRFSLPAAPAVFHFDAKEHRGRIIRHPVWHHRLSLLTMAANNLLRRHDPM